MVVTDLAKQPQPPLTTVLDLYNHLPPKQSDENAAHAPSLPSPTPFFPAS